MLEPLAKAYSIPKTDPDRDSVMEAPARGVQRSHDIIRMCGRS
jgi:hypothetical protein